MKSRLLLFSVIMISIVTFSSCSKDDTSADPAQTEQNVQSGTWHVTLFNDSGENKTGNFSGYNFVFGQNGSVSASNGTVTQNGTLSVFIDSGDTKFVLSFPVTSGPFEEISEDWRVVSQSATKIELVNISGGNGGTDYLTFEKN